jgi:hypothetical protein
MSRRDCHCPVPDEHGPIRPNYCRCGGYIDPRWTSTDETVAEFMEQLAQIPGVPPWFIAMCEKREVDGRPIFGHAFMDRQNCDEGIEEFLDACVYAHLHLLKCRREGKREQIELALEISQHAAEGAALFARMKALN